MHLLLTSQWTKYPIITFVQREKGEKLWLNQIQMEFIFYTTLLSAVVECLKQYTVRWFCKSIGTQFFASILINTVYQASECD